VNGHDQAAILTAKEINGLFLLQKKNNKLVILTTHCYGTVATVKPIGSFNYRVVILFAVK